MSYLDQYEFTPEQQHVINRLNEDQRFGLEQGIASFAIEGLHFPAEEIVNQARVTLGDVSADDLIAAKIAAHRQGGGRA
ncbi:hypothetical protein GSY69_10930 [Brevibacterium sp. 5221]|uniref:Antitoxin VbhA domain-containing protein n=1 Tax=Brevibacterium rongguiense TaxID=2695267 RepID=A0A6N9H8W5_9MICO|nr:hypothetical protein [Brevibacterium rongguiense]MYM20463.1 hypothetical protein [Brevibacterium rongguiense]